MKKNVPTEPGRAAHPGSRVDAVYAAPTPAPVTDDDTRRAPYPRNYIRSPPATDLRAFQCVYAGPGYWNPQNQLSANDLSSSNLGAPPELLAQMTQQAQTMPQPDTELPAEDCVFCTQCGAKIRATAKFCTECGAPQRRMD